MPRFQLSHRPRKVGATLALPGGVRTPTGRRCVFVRQFDVFAFAAVSVVGEVAGNAKEVVLPVRFAFICDVRSKKAIVRFLQEIIRQFAAAGSPEQINPQRAGGPIVYRAKRVLVHLKRFGFGCDGFDPLEFGKSDVTHEEVKLPRCRSLKGAGCC